MSIPQIVPNNDILMEENRKLVAMASVSNGEIEDCASPSFQTDAPDDLDLSRGAFALALA